MSLRSAFARARLARMLAVVMLGGLLVPACSLATALAESPCHFPGLTLVRNLVCFKIPPTVNRDGSWTWPTSDPKTKQLKKGTIVIVAKKAVRRVSAVPRYANGHVRIATEPVPLTQVVVNGEIPLAPHSGRRVRMDQVDLATPKPVVVPPMTVRQYHPPPPPYTPPPSSPPPTVTVSASVLRAVYDGPCPPPADQAPEFQAVISVSAKPAQVTYQWLTSNGGSSDPSIKTLYFPAGGSRQQTVQFTQSGYLPGATIKDWIKIYVTGPDGRTISSAPLGYEITCEQPVSSPIPSPSTSTTQPVPGAQTPPVTTLAYIQQSAEWTVGDYKFSPSISRQPGRFSISLLATRQLGPALLAFDIRGTLGDFTSRGLLRVHDHHLAHSSMGAGGVGGRLDASWSLSAAVPEAITNALSLNASLPLFRWPLLIGDFPVFLGGEIRLHLAPDFGHSAQILHGRAEVSFSGTQGLTFSEQSPAVPAGGLLQEHRGLTLHPGGVFALPKLQFDVTFPYLEVGDDFYDPVAGALVWTGFTLSTVTASGVNPGLCLRTDATVHADVGVTAWLFGLRTGASQQLYARPVGSVSLPANPACLSA